MVSLDIMSHSIGASTWFHSRAKAEEGAISTIGVTFPKVKLVIWNSLHREILRGFHETSNSQWYPSLIVGRVACVSLVFIVDDMV